jgi:hypothetical protein
MTPESQNRRPLLSNDSANRFPLQRISKQQLWYVLVITTEALFSVGSALRLYNEDPRPAELILLMEGVS